MRCGVLLVVVVVPKGIKNMLILLGMLDILFINIEISLRIRIERTYQQSFLIQIMKNKGRLEVIFIGVEISLRIRIERTGKCLK